MHIFTKSLGCIKTGERFIRFIYILTAITREKMASTVDGCSNCMGKDALGEFIKSQMQYLATRLSNETGEECFIVTATNKDVVPSLYGSKKGKAYMKGWKAVQEGFLPYLKKEVEDKKLAQGDVKVGNEAKPPPKSKQTKVQGGTATTDTQSKQSGLMKTFSSLYQMAFRKPDQTKNTKEDDATTIHTTDIPNKNAGNSADYKRKDHGDSDNVNPSKKAKTHTTEEQKPIKSKTLKIKTEIPEASSQKMKSEDVTESNDLDTIYLTDDDDDLDSDEDFNEDFNEDYKKEFDENFDEDSDFLRKMPKPRPYICTICGNGFSQKSILKEHYNKTHSDKYQEGQQKPMDKSESPTLSKNADNGAVEPEIEIPKNKVLTSYEEIKETINEAKSIRDYVKSKVLRCFSCKKDFTSAQILRVHLIDEHSKGIKTHPCPKCGKRFPKAGSVAKHQKICST